MLSVLVHTSLKRLTINITANTSWRNKSMKYGTSILDIRIYMWESSKRVAGIKSVIWVVLNLLVQHFINDNRNDDISMKLKGMIPKISPNQVLEIKFLLRDKLKSMHINPRKWKETPSIYIYNDEYPMYFSPGENHDWRNTTNQYQFQYGNCNGNCNGDGD